MTTGIKITGMPFAFAAQFTDVLAEVQGGVTKQVNLNQIASLFGITGGILQPSAGGTGVSDPTAHTLPVAEGSSPFNFLGPLTDGQLLIGSTGNDPVPATLTSGTGISISNASGSITISASQSGIAWSTISGTTQSAAVNNGYVSGNAAQTTITLPTTFAVGDVVIVKGLGAGGWILAAGTATTIRMGSSVTSSAGSLTSTNQYDTVYVTGLVANTTWSVDYALSSGLTVA